MAAQDGGTQAQFGIGCGLGISYWYAAWTGIKLEVGYELHFERDPLHELVVAAGPVFGW